MNINKLNDETRLKLLKTICEFISNAEEDVLDGLVDSILTPLVEVLDELGDDDAFGTEGWKHLMGVDL